MTEKLEVEFNFPRRNPEAGLIWRRSRVPVLSVLHAPFNIWCSSVHRSGRTRSLSGWELPGEDTQDALCWEVNPHCRELASVQWTFAGLMVTNGTPTQNREEWILNQNGLRYLPTKKTSLISAGMWCCIKTSEQSCCLCPTYSKCKLAWCKKWRKWNCEPEIHLLPHPLKIRQ